MQIEQTTLHTNNTYLGSNCTHCIQEFKTLCLLRHGCATGRSRWLTFEMIIAQSYILQLKWQFIQISMLFLSDVLYCLSANISPLKINDYLKKKKKLKQRRTLHIQ